MVWIVLLFTEYPCLQLVPAYLYTHRGALCTQEERTQRLFFLFFILLVFCLGGRKRDVWHAEEHRAKGRCGAFSLDSTHHHHGLLFSPCYDFSCIFWMLCRHWSYFSSLHWCRKRKPLDSLEVCVCLSHAELSPIPQAHPGTGGSPTTVNLWG